jgi:hypothetical protein
MIEIEVVEGDVLRFSSDVLAVKYAQQLYGVDLAVYSQLSGQSKVRLPKMDGFTLHKTEHYLGASAVLFVGVAPLRQFDYHKIREFGRKVLASLAGEAPNTRHLALTLHGPGYGLDELEAFKAETAGLIEAMASGDYPSALERVSFVERNPGRASRLKAALSQLVPLGSISTGQLHPLASLGEGPRQTLRTVGYDSATKPYVFVAMPFDEDLDDLFHFGIEGTVRKSGFLCERADLSTFSGDIVEYVKERISRASLVIGVLSKANPNVYLEVGYAWGCKRRTILAVSDISELKFDVRGQRVLEYKSSIRKLEEKLAKELLSLTGTSAEALA